MSPTRPPLTSVRTGAELRRWYWLRAELAALARHLGVKGTGGKIELTDRLAAVLDGLPPRPPAPAVHTVDELSPPLSGTTVLRPGQRCTQLLRSWFVARLGPGFRFDAAMRAYVAEGGHTLDDAVDHWQATRPAAGSAPPQIGAQFELNRFARAWHVDHPGRSHRTMLIAWRDHRSRPRHPV